MDKVKTPCLCGLVSPGPRALLPTRGFSLIELLVVMTIIALLLALVGPAFNSIASGSNLSRGGQIVGDQIALARQEAVTKNRDVEVVFFYMTNGVTAGWRGIQLWRVDQVTNGFMTNAVTRLQVLPEGVIMSSNAVSSDLSPLLNHASIVGLTNAGGYGVLNYRAFRFRANGLIDNSVGTASNFITLQNVTDHDPPVNYYTIQVNALTGKVTVFRP